LGVKTTGFIRLGSEHGGEPLDSIKDGEFHDWMCGW